MIKYYVEKGALQGSEADNYQAFSDQKVAIMITNCKNFFEFLSQVILSIQCIFHTKDLEPAQARDYPLTTLRNLYKELITELQSDPMYSTSQDRNNG